MLGWFPWVGEKRVVFAVNNPFTAALNPNHGTPNSAGISARVVRFRRTRGGHDSTQGRRSESEKTEIDSESCGVTVAEVSWKHGWKESSKIICSFARGV